MASVVDSGNYRKTLSLLSQTYERDKLGKILQYLYRYYSWKASSEGRNKDAALYMKISSSLSMSRKLFRVGYSLEELAKLVKLLDIKGPVTYENVLGVVRSAISCVFWALDNLYWAQKLELFNVVDTGKLNKWRVTTWLATVALALQPAIKAWLVARQAEKKDDPKSQQAVNVQTANLVRVFGDLVVSTNFAIQVGVVPEWVESHDGLTGLAGVTSGLAGLYQAWSGGK